MLSTVSKNIVYIQLPVYNQKHTYM